MQTLPLLGASNHVFIGGHWRDGAARETLPLLNPSDGSRLAPSRGRVCMVSS